MTNGTNAGNKFEKFKGFYAEYANSKNSAKANDASGRTNGRNYALGFLDTLSYDADLAYMATPENLDRIQRGDQAYIDTILDLAVSYNTDKIRGELKADNLEAIINDAPKDKIGKNFIGFQPVGVKGNDWHNERAQVHGRIYRLQGALQGDEEAVERVEDEIKVEYVGQRLEVFKEKLEKNKDLSKETVQKALNALSFIYSRRDLRFSQNDFGKYVIDASKRITSEFEKMFKNEDEKVRYATTNITEGAKMLLNQGEEGFDKAAGLIGSIDR